MNALRILLADDHPLIRKGMKSILETFDDVGEIVEANDGKHAIELSKKQNFDLFILDYKMPLMDGYDTAKILLTKNAFAKIMVISMYSETVLVLNLFKLGVLGFLIKNSDITEIESGINKVLRGEQYLSKAVEARIQREEDQFSKPLGALKLTLRESELVQLLSKGKSSKEISITFGLSLKTIETYRSRILKKINVKNTAELLNYCSRNGLIQYSETDFSN